MSYITKLKSSQKQMQEELQKKLDEVKNSGKGKKDTRFWTPPMGADKTGSAIIRFLPAPEGETLPFAKYYDYYFKGPGGVYFEKSLSTFEGQKDPVGIYNSSLWNSGEEGKAKARDQKRRLHIVSNVFVVKDSEFPENEGKVFLFRYGIKIWDKIEAASKPDNKNRIDPFNLFAPSIELSRKDAMAWVDKNGLPGANFNINVRMVGEFKNYDLSAFDVPMSLAETLGLTDETADAKLEEICKQCHSLSQFTDPSTFKSFDQLQEILNRVLSGNGHGAPSNIESKLQEDNSIGDDEPPFDLSKSSDMSEFERLLNTK